MPNPTDTKSGRPPGREGMSGNRETGAQPRTAADENEEYRKKIGLLCKVGGKVSSAPELSKLLQQILRMSQKTLRVSASSVLLLDKNKQELYFKVAEGKVEKVLRTVRISIDSGIAGWVVRNAKPLISNDVINDARFNKGIDKITGFVTKSVLAVPMISGQEVIGVIEVLNKTDNTIFNRQDLEVLTTVASLSAVAINNTKLHHDVVDAYKSTANALSAAIDAKDPYTRGHSQRVMEYTLLAATSFSFPPEELRAIEFGSLLHDVGKIGIDSRILRKADDLNRLEWLEMRMHPVIGANIIGVAPYLEKVRELVLHHHEKYDGTGYPEGLKGDDIPIGSRLIAVADAFDTITTSRSYRSSVSVDEALDELDRLNGIQFCPVAVKAFVSAFSKQREMLAYHL